MELPIHEKKEHVHTKKSSLREGCNMKPTFFWLPSPSQPVPLLPTGVSQIRVGLDDEKRETENFWSPLGGPWPMLKKRRQKNDLKLPANTLTLAHIHSFLSPPLLDVHTHKKVQ